jgi:hypothetical protein
MTSAEFRKLKTLALAATPGPWAADLPGNWDDVLQGAYCVKASDNGPDSDEEAHTNARFIAAANPTAILALIAEIERLENIAFPLVTVRDDENAEAADEESNGAVPG